LEKGKKEDWIGFFCIFFSVELAWDQGELSAVPGEEQQPGLFRATANPPDRSSVWPRRCTATHCCPGVLTQTPENQPSIWEGYSRQQWELSAKEEPFWPHGLLKNYSALKSLHFPLHQSFPHTVSEGCLSSSLTTRSMGSIERLLLRGATPPEQHLPGLRLPGTGGVWVLAAPRSNFSCVVSCCLFVSCKNPVSSQGKQVRLHY